MKADIDKFYPELTDRAIRTAALLASGLALVYGLAPPFWLGVCFIGIALVRLVVMLTIKYVMTKLETLP